MQLETVAYHQGSSPTVEPRAPADPLDLIQTYAGALRDPIHDDLTRHALADAIVTHARWLQDALGTPGDGVVIDLARDGLPAREDLPSGARTVVIYDPHPIARHGLRSLIDAEPDLRVVGETDEIADLLRLTRSVQADCALVDLGRTDEGLTLVHAIAVSGVLVAVFSARNDLPTVIAALEAGAAGYILKASDPVEIVSAVRSLRHGATYVSPPLVGPLAHNASPNGRRRDVALTARERQILRLLADGRSARQIASHLGIAERTVQTHLGNLYRRAGVDNRVDAIRWGVHEGIVEPLTPTAH